MRKGGLGACGAGKQHDLGKPGRSQQEVAPSWFFQVPKGHHRKAEAVHIYVQAGEPASDRGVVLVAEHSTVGAGSWLRLAGQKKHGQGSQFLPSPTSIH